jgi:imidazolonepropionase-like amidohydrolase
MSTNKCFKSLKTLLFSSTLMLALAGCATDALQAEATDQLLLTNVNIVDTSQSAIRSGALLIAGGVIQAELSGAPTDFGGKIVDLKGRWLVPGLIDMHVHAFGNRAPDTPNDSPGIEAISIRLLYAGVTGFVDLFGDEPNLMEVKERQQAKQFFGADVFASLSCITAPKGHCSEYGIPTRTLTSPEEAQQHISALATNGADVIKIVYQPSDDQPSIDKPTFKGLVSAADALGLSTIVHIKTWQDIRDSIEVGATAITHTPRAPIPRDMPALMASAGITIIPTLTVETDLTDFVFDASVTEDPLAQAMTTTQILGSYTSYAIQERWQDRLPRWSAANAQTLENVRQMNAAGVNILAGTDSGNWGTIQGYSLHREMLKLTQAGLTNWQALAASTTKARAFMKLAPEWQRGTPASFIVLNSSPVENIENTKDIFMVIHNGVIVDRDAVRLSGRD